MSVPFAALVNPALMWLGLGLASVPIIIHLLNRRRVRPVRWAAMRWLAAALKRHQRRLKIENWLLLLLRMAAIALLGLALARPILDSKLAGALGGKRSVYLLLDNSYSTEAKVDARSVFERVRHQAGQILDSLGPDDAVAVVLTNDPAEGTTSGTSPYVLQPRTVGGEGAARAKEALAAGVRPRHASAHWTDAFRKLQEQMAPEDVGRQVYVVTDFQARDWSTAGGSGDTRLRAALEDVLRSPAAVRIVDVGGQDRRNLAVVEVEELTEPAPFVGRPASLAVKVANHGGKLVQGATLEVVVGESGFRRTVTIPEIEAAQTNLSIPTPGIETVHVDLPAHAFESPGVHIVQCQIGVPSGRAGADALARDSTRWFALHVRPQISVLGWVESSDNEAKDAAEDYVKGIYVGVMPGASEETTEDGMPWFFRYEGVRFEANLMARLRERNERRVDLVVLANTIPRDPRAVKQLKSFVSEGGGLLVMVGDKVADADALNSLLYTEDGPSLLPRPFQRLETRNRSTPDTQPFSFDMRPRKGAHPVARPFTDEAAQDWTALFPPKVWARMPFGRKEQDEGDTATDGPPEDDAVVMSYADGQAAIVAGSYGLGRTLWFGTSIDNGWIADAGVIFVPVLLNDAALWLTEPRSEHQNLSIGGSVLVRAPVGAANLRLTVPGGNQVSPNPVGDAAEGAVTLPYRYDDVGMAGPWRFTYERTRVDGERETVEQFLAVNVDPAEGMLHAARPAHVTDSGLEGLDLTFASTFESEETLVDEANQGELTRWLLWIVLGFLILESILALRFGRRSVVANDESTA